MAKILAVDYGSFEELQKKMAEYGAGAGQIVDKVLLEEGSELIQKAIQPLIHPSGKTWVGKRQSAATASINSVFRTVSESLKITVYSQKTYNYLYFPDDGSNTKRHAGNQDFMLHGAENASTEVLNRCIAALISDFENN